MGYVFFEVHTENVFPIYLGIFRVEKIIPEFLSNNQKNGFAINNAFWRLQLPKVAIKWS